MNIAYLYPILLALLWGFQSWLIEHSSWAPGTLSSRMAAERVRWIRTMSRRDLRMIDTNIIGGLQSGTAFFASTSLFAIGASFSLAKSGEAFALISEKLPFVQTSGAVSFEMKTIGLMLIYAYAFLKFGWAYRLFNYTSILIGSVPMLGEGDERELVLKSAEFETQVRKASQMSIQASKEFNRGQRAFFIAIAYLGWFAGDKAFVAAMLSVYGMLIYRQFFSSAGKALAD